MTAVELRPAVHAPGRIGQGTAVEQSRAVAEVEAAVIVAQRVPRNIARAERDMERACARKELASKAFFRFRRGGEQISGETVQLARELARCWGNIQYGLTELRRDDAYGQSEMQAWAWDVETNARASTTFIVPHRRDRSEAKGGPVALTDMRDIYENNANNGARRLREMIFAILPVWYITAAVEACYETIAKDGEDGVLSTDAAVTQFAKIGVKAAQLEQKLGGPRSTWTARDLAELRVIYTSIMRGEVSKEDEFPGAARVTAEEITGKGHQTSAPAAEPAPAAGAEPAPPRQPRQRKPAHVDRGEQGINFPTAQHIAMEFKRLGIEDRNERLTYTALMAGVPDGTDLKSTTDLSEDTQERILADLKACADMGQLYALVKGGDAPAGGDN